MFEIKDTGITPPCGWVFKVAQMNIDIEASSYDQLVTKARQIYEINHQPIPEDLEQQIHKHICQLCPTGVCKSFFNRFAFAARTLMNGTAAFSMMMRKGKGGLVSPEEAERRAAICTECSYNTDNPPCYKCRSYETIIQRVTHGRSTTKDDQINVCGMCGCFLRAMVHCDVGVLRAATPKRSVRYYPDHCWKKQQLK